jgi:hypothetical protein
MCYGRTKMEEILTAKDLSEGTTEDSFDSKFSWMSEVTKANPSLGQEEKWRLDAPRREETQYFAGTMLFGGGFFSHL